MIKIEKMSDTGGHSEKETEVKDALIELNVDIENGMTIWLDNKPFMEDMLLDEHLNKVKCVSVTNKLTGG